MIPAEAVEAAAKASYEARGGIDWDLQSDELRDAETVFTRAALEAAAPHIRADALDDAAKKLRSDIDVPQRIWVANKVRALAMIERGDV